jgi:hypothetical protein
MQPPPPYEEALRMHKPSQQCDVISKCDDVITDGGHANVIAEAEVEVLPPDLSSTARSDDDDGVVKKMLLLDSFNSVS